jgi:hypothetical protein
VVEGVDEDVVMGDVETTSSGFIDHDIKLLSGSFAG